MENEGNGRGAGAVDDVVGRGLGAVVVDAVGGAAGLGAVGGA